MTDDCDAALAELETAGVLVPAGFDDPNGNPAFRFVGFPPGAEGERLRVLFDKHIQARNRLADAAAPR
jgi:hypothetical protein